MDVVKWIFSAIIGMVLAAGAVAVVVGSVIFATVLQIIAAFGFVAGGIAMLIKEKLDESKDR